MIITKMALPRRTFLRGLGAAFALPMLDAMVPAFSAAQRSAAKPVCRLGFIYVPNGVAMNDSLNYWTPKGTGTSFELSPILAPLAPLPRSTDDRQRSRAEAGGIARRRQRRAHAGVRHLAERRPSEEDRRRRHQAWARLPIRSRRHSSAGNRAAVDGDDLVGNRSRPRRPVRSRATAAPT